MENNPSWWTLARTDPWEYTVPNWDTTELTTHQRFEPHDSSQLHNKPALLAIVRQ